MKEGIGLKFCDGQYYIRGVPIAEDLLTTFLLLNI